LNAVEIEQEVSKLAEAPFDPAEFPYAFLTAFGNKETTLKRLRSGATNKSDLGGVLQTGNIHIAVCAAGETAKSLAALRSSPATARAKARFILATDGEFFEAEDLTTADTVARPYGQFPDHFGFFLPLAGITTVAQVRENAFDIRATSRLNRLYVELLKDNPDWGAADRRHDMNHFMARLIFCFFAEKTDIFFGDGLFSDTVAQMSAKDSSDTHEVVSAIFRAMSTKTTERAAWGCRPWADAFPYVNGGLFSGDVAVPRFSRIARSYLLHIGGLDWRKINPDIFGSMIQAVADDEERGALGLHYTSVPNILKVLNPLFLDDLRAKFAEADDNARMLLNLRKRLSRIRVFDPACGSGNFLVIAYKEMRRIEAEINGRRGEKDRKSEIPLTNFRGIELRDFPAEIARLALIIAEYQCDVAYRGQKEALRDFLPLNSQNWITCGNALRLDWLSVCPPTGKETKIWSDDLFGAPLDQARIDFENEGGETYICGNPPFKGARKQSLSQKEDMAHVFGGGNAYKDCDYVVCWFLKASQYSTCCDSNFAFVATNSISRGEQVQHLWARLYQMGSSIAFAHKQFKWQNSASDNAGVWCVVIGISKSTTNNKYIYDENVKHSVRSISPYIIVGNEDYIEKVIAPISKQLPKLVSGSMARDGGNLILSNKEKELVLRMDPQARVFMRPLIGTTEIKQGTRRWAVWVRDADAGLASQIEPIKERISAVKRFRMASDAKTTKGYAAVPHRFAQRCHVDIPSIVLPKNTVEGLLYLTPIFVDAETVTTDLAFVAYFSELWVLALLASTIHRVWAEAISGGLGSGVRYSSEITYNAFPMPTLTEKNKADLTRRAEDILLAREAHFPATIADLYDPEAMPTDLRAAHERNDETLERIYIGRRFKNDTERLEKLFEMYTKMVAATGPKAPKRKPASKLEDRDASM
jgi:hypothetical protein